MMVKKKSGYGLYVIAAVVLIVAVAIMFYSSGTFGQAIKLGNYKVRINCIFDYPPGTVDSQMKMNTCKDERWGNTCSGVKSCLLDFEKKYGQNFHVSSSCGGAGVDARVDGRGREFHFTCGSVVKVLPAVQPPTTTAASMSEEQFQYHLGRYNDCTNKLTLNKESKGTEIYDKLSKECNMLYEKVRYEKVCCAIDGRRESLTYDGCRTRRGVVFKLGECSTEAETYARPPEPTPAPNHERAVMPPPVSGVPQIISSVLSYMTQGGQKAPYTLDGKNYVVELVYAKPGERVKMVVNGESLSLTPGTPTVIKDGTIIFVTGVELKSAERSDVQFLLLSQTASTPCKECPSCPTPAHIVMADDRQTWVVKDPYGIQKEYDVEVLVVDSVNKQAKFKINGEITDAIPIGGTDTLSDGSMVVVADVRNVQVEAAILPVPLNWKYASSAR